MMKVKVLMRIALDTIKIMIPKALSQVARIKIQMELQPPTRME